MNVVVMRADGVRSRVGAKIHKQLVEVDAIEVVISNGWERYLSELVEHEGFSKVCWTAPAGDDFQHSVISSIKCLGGKAADDDVILVHYGARFMVLDGVISNAIRVCGIYGNASPAHSQVYLAAERQDGESADGWFDRDEIMVLNSPQALRYGYVTRLYDEAERRGLLATNESIPRVSCSRSPSVSGSPREAQIT